MDIGIIIALLALVGTLATFVGGTYQVRSTSRTVAAAAAAATIATERTAAREELELALEDQRQRLATIHEGYEKDTELFKRRHARDIAELQVRADAAEASAAKCAEELAAITVEVVELKGQVNGT